jgi:N,N'-diacetylchitobiose transport system permease protein
MCAATRTGEQDAPVELSTEGYRVPLRWRRRGRLAPYAMLAPALFVIALILAYPLFNLVALSFQHYGLRQLLAHQGEWVGLDNYVNLVRDPTFRTVLVRSLVFAAFNVTATIVLGTLVALLMERIAWLLRVVVTAALVLVWSIPVIVAVDVWQWMFDFEFGIVNWLLTNLHLGNFTHHNWYENPIQGFGVISVILIWGALPFVIITLYAGLSQVPRELVEAAEVDGANPAQVFRNVTVPVLRPLFVILVSLSTIWDFQVFNQIWVLLNYRPSKDYYVIGVYAFLESFNATQYGSGAAIAVVMVAVLFVATFFYIRYYVRQAVGSEGAT